MNPFGERSLRLRPATVADLPEICAIYGYHVRTGAASFEMEPPSVEEMARRFMAVQVRGFPYFTAEYNKEVVGYSYVQPYRPRPAYRYTVENSVYVREDQRGRGCGRALLGALIDECMARGLRQMIAVIGDSRNEASISLHRALGFVDVGVLRNVGYKFDRWVDSVLMQRTLGAGADGPPGGLGDTVEPRH